MKLKYYKSVFLISLLLSGISISNAQTDIKDSINTPNNYIELKNIGYGVQKPALVTGAISSVNGSSLEQNFNINIGNTLYGRIPGLTISQGSSDPGANTNAMVMRGRNTLGSGSAPLLIIDGFLAGRNELGGLFNQLVPEEIESVTLLKDAGATALYGMRGANGVLLITTKRGYKTPLKVDFSTKQGFSQPQYLPKFLDAAQYATLFNEARINEGLAPTYLDTDIEAYRTGSDPYLYPNVNWYDEVLRKSAPVSSYNLNFTGGDATVKYFVMLNALSTQGLYKKFGDRDPESINSQYDRYNFRTNLDVNLSKRLSVAFNLGGSVENKANPFEVDASNTFNLLQQLPANAFPVFNPDGSFGGKNIYSGNPVGNLLATGFDKSNGRSLQTALRLTQQLDMITKGLSVSGVASINNYFVSSSERNKGYERFAYALNSNTGLGQVVLPAIGTKSTLQANEITRNQYRNFELQGSLNYARVFDKHDLSAMLMMSTDNQVLNFTSAANTAIFDYQTDPYKHNALAGRVTYAYNNKYIAEFSAGYMGSENFEKGKRYGFFPAGSAGWIISNEKFLSAIKAINFLKLRASYGLAGNDNMGGRRYAYYQTYAFQGTEGPLADPNSTWEKEKTFNVGLDATLIKNLSITFDAFKRNRFDQLVTPDATVPSLIGATLTDINIGEMFTNGFEASLRWNSNTDKKLQYFVETGFSYYHNKIVFDGQIPQANKGLVTTGAVFGQPRRYRALGFFTQEEINNLATDPKATIAGVPVRAGDIKYEDVGGLYGQPDGIIDAYDRVPVGKPGTPNATLGLNAGFQFKGFDLNMVFQAVTGNSTYLSGGLFHAFQNNGSIAPIALGRWTPETSATATYPRLSPGNNLNNFVESSFWVRDASFIKFRSAELGYTLPKNISNIVKLSSARVFLTGTNLFSWDKIEYGDPESLSGYPVLRTFVIGAKIKI